MKKTKVRIVLVDDQPLFSGPLAIRLDQEPDFEVVGAGKSAQEAVALCMKHTPDVLLLDIDMPGMSCFEAARQIGRLRPQTKRIFVSGHWEDRYIEDALKAEAHGYLTKNEMADTLVRAIREVVAGGAYFSKEVQSRLVLGSGGARLAGPRRTRTSTLTPREREIMTYLTKGMDRQLIAENLGVAFKTADNHLTTIMRKLDIHTMVDLVRFAIREGFGKA